MVPPALGTRINGKVYDFSSVEIVIDGIAYQNVTEINYSHGVEPGVLRGTSAMMRGRSRGSYDTDGSLSMYKEDYANMIGVLAGKGLGGYMMAEFLVMVAFRDIGAVVPCIDTLHGCRIKRDEDSLSSGGDVIVVKVDLSVFEVVRNGLHAIDVPGRAANFKP